MSGSSGSTQAAYGLPGVASSVRRRPVFLLALASLPFVFVLGSDFLVAVVAAFVLSPFGLDVAVFGSAAAAIGLPAGLAVVSAVRPWWTAGLLGATFGSIVWLTDVGGGGGWLWLTAFWFMWVLAMTALVLNRWARVSVLLSTAVAAVGLVGFFAGAAVLVPSIELAVAATLYAGFTVVMSVFLPVGAFAGAAARARLTREDLPVGVAAQPDVRAVWKEKRDAECAVADTLATLPDSFKVLHSVELSDDVAPVDHLVFGPTGVTVVAVTSAQADVMSDQLHQVLGLVAQQRLEVMERLGVAQGKVFGLVVSVPADGSDDEGRRGLFAVRPVGVADRETTVPVVPLAGLVAELDTPFTVMRAQDVDLAAAKARMKFRPARVMLQRGERAVFAVQVGDVSPDGDVMWERDPIADLSNGAAIALMTPSGLVPGFRVVAAPAMRDGVMAALVCFEDDYSATGQVRETQVFAYPVAAIRPDTD